MHVHLAQKNKALPEGTSKRNYECASKLNVKIKLLTENTVRKDAYLTERPPLQGVVTISGKHSHNFTAGSITKYLRPGEELRAQFYGYFQEMSVAAAIRLHELNVTAMEDGKRKCGDGHYNPQQSTVYYWYRQWRTLRRST